MYVDDLIIVSQSVAQIKRLKDLLCGEFKMVDFGEINTILGIKVRRDKKNGVLSLSLEKYALIVLKKFNMQDCKSAEVPLQVGVKYQQTKGSAGLHISI